MPVTSASRDRREQVTRLAVIWVGAGDARLFSSAPAAVKAELPHLERLRDGSFRVPLADVEQVVSSLDRLGFVWATDKVQLPRTWAERMFAEVPADLWDDLLEALVPVLSSHRGDPVALSVLRLAHARAFAAADDADDRDLVERVVRRTSQHHDPFDDRPDHPSSADPSADGKVLRLCRRESPR